MSRVHVLQGFAVLADFRTDYKRRNAPPKDHAMRILSCCRRYKSGMAQVSLAMYHSQHSALLPCISSNTPSSLLLKIDHDLQFFLC